MLFLSSKGGGDGLWRLKDGAVTELWEGSDGGVVAARLVGGSEKRDAAVLHRLTSDVAGKVMTRPRLAEFVASRPAPTVISQRWRPSTRCQSCSGRPVAAPGHLVPAQSSPDAGCSLRGPRRRTICTIVTTMTATTSTVVAISAASIDSASHAIAEPRPQSTHAQPASR